MEDFLKISELFTNGLGLILAIRVLYKKKKEGVDPTVWDVFIIAVLLS